MGTPEPTIVRVEFHADGAKTRMTLTDGPQPFASQAEAGWNAALDELTAHRG